MVQDLLNKLSPSGLSKGARAGVKLPPPGEVPKRLASTPGELPKGAKRTSTPLWKAFLRFVEGTKHERGQMASPLALSQRATESARHRQSRSRHAA